ncbi:MAG: hypothetical protein H6733_11215 [Alphaproteobacteria bacterium]|nr:hypothetical protein [Alphaproteobacteria bacterium]
MIRLLLSLLLLSGLGTAATAVAQSKDDDFTEEDDEPFFDDEMPDDEPPPEKKKEEPKKDDAKKADDKKADEGPPPSGEDDEDLLDDEFSDPVDDGGEPVEEEDLFEDERNTRDDLLQEGVDNPRVFRAREAEISSLPPDEEAMAWEAYLQEYPNSIFRERIEAHMDELQRAEYGNRIGRDGQATVDANTLELDIVQPLHLVTLNPRTKVTAGIDMGFGAGPLYTGGIADFEYAILRKLSVHGGVSGRYTGWGLEVGTRYAFVKSARDRLVATISADFRLNFNPLFFQVRPMIGFAKMFGPADKPFGKSQIQVVAGAEIGTRKQETVAITGGVHLSFRLAQPVALYVESDVYARNLGRAEGPFVFENVALGFKFYPTLKSRKDDALELAVGAGLPAASTYIQPYQGAAQVQGVYYLPPREKAAKVRSKK